MFASVPSAVLFCAEGHLIHVEVQVSGGLPGFSLVGLPDTSIRESRDRARAAVLSSGLPWPRHRITVNLAPSGDRKAGSGLDLAIAVGVLAASDVIPSEALEGIAFIAEVTSFTETTPSVITESKISPNCCTLICPVATASVNNA